MRISLNLIATGRYSNYLNQIIESCVKYFLPEHEIYYIVHTDCTEKRDIKNLIVNKIDFEPWPNPTLKRFHYFLMKEEEILKSDFSFYVDVDSLFVNPVKLPLEEMSGIIPTLHPGFYDKVGTPERNPLSRAYIPKEAKNLYFCGGFFGGDSKSFIEMSKTIKAGINEDLDRDIIAKWHDESHLNHYLFHNPPKNILGNNFAISEKHRGEFPNSPLIFLEKNHSEMRGIKEDIVNE